jgi:iron(III) transport system ATP-binding protein
MNAARIAQDGTPRELYNAPASRFIADFMGDANLLEAEVGAHHGERAEVTIGPLTLSLPHRGIGPGRASLAVRPHAVRILARQAGAGEIDGRIVKGAYLGDHMEYRIATSEPAGEVFATSSDVSTELAPGAPVAVTFDPDSVVLVPKA